MLIAQEKQKPLRLCAAITWQALEEVGFDRLVDEYDINEIKIGVPPDTYRTYAEYPEMLQQINKEHQAEYREKFQYFKSKGIFFQFTRVCT